MLLCVIAMTLSNQDLPQIGNAREVTFETSDGLTLQGELVLPANATHGVLLLPGSGPTDRDGSQPPHLRIDLLREIARDLSLKQVATLRFDKRAFGRYASEWPTDLDEVAEFFAFSKFLDDANRAFKLLESEMSITAKVGILGHSEGATIALSIANDVEADFVVAAGTPGRTYLELLTWQLEKNLKPPVVTEEARENLLKHNERISAYIIANGRLPSDIPLHLTALYNASVPKYWQQVFNISGVELLRATEAPVFIVQAEYDAQIDLDEDYSLLRAALQEKDSSVVIPKASHNFKQVDSPELPGFEGPVISEFLTRVSDWIRSH